MDEHTQLKREIEELRFELKQRESDLETYRSELVRANVELESIIEEVTKQLTVAARIQKLLTPTEYPNISGFEFSSKFVPGTRFGGDYFDIFEHNNKLRFGIVMASCSGYSMSALLLSVLLKFSGVLESKKGTENEQVLAGIFAELKEGMGEKDSASLFYGYVDRRSYQLNYVYTGDLTCMAVDAESGKITKLEQLSSALTANHIPEISSSSISLNSKDRLILCSSGVSQAMGVDGESFGTERIYKSVIGKAKDSVHDVRNEILYRLRKHRNTEDVERDVTVLVAEVKDHVIKLA